MPTEYDDDLLREGILRLKAGEFDTARGYLERALQTADDNRTRAQASYYLSRLTDDPQQKRKLLEETLAVDLAHAEARRELAILDGRLKREEIINPEQPPSLRTGTETVQAECFTCPKCGGRMVYIPSGAALVCEFCNREEHSGTGSPGSEQDFFVAMANGRGFHKTISVKTFLCKGCGADFILAPQVISSACAYCGSTHVIALKQLRDLVEPDVILPMAFDQRQASRILTNWMAQKQIEPQGMLPAPRGLYLPVWTFDIMGSIPWHGRVVRNKRETPVSGERVINFNNVSVAAARSLSALLEKTLPEFKIDAGSAYDPCFLAGWPAEVHERTMAEASLDARQKTVEQVRAIIREEFGHVLDLTYSTSSIMITSYKLILVPVWVTQLTTLGQKGQVLINGQGGSIHTDLPGQEPGWLDSLLEGGRFAADPDDHSRTCPRS